MPRLIHADGRSLSLGYCTNVDAAETLHQLEEGLGGLWRGVRAEVFPTGVLGVGLWLPAAIAFALRNRADRAKALRNRIADAGLFCFTLNAFPYGGFHDAVVKTKVYRPAWNEPDRLDYTVAAAAALAALLTDDRSAGSLSTVPLGWRADVGPSERRAARAALLACAEALAGLEDRTGKRVTVLLEPEPGCALETTDDALAIWGELLADARTPAATARVERYLGVCFDCCHQAVIGEDCADALRRLRRARVPVGKLHVSSALEGPCAELRPYAEPRYLHQTFGLGDAAGHRADDLPAALADPVLAGARVRTHFHVPVHLERLAGRLRTTRGDMLAALDEALSWPEDELPDLEVETYTWGVLPEPPSSREAGIAAELADVLREVRDRGFVPE